MADKLSGTITDEAIAEMRQRIGKPRPYPGTIFFLQPNTDAFRNVAWAYGDDNPLWIDPDYALKSRWGSVIAPPAMVGGDGIIGETRLNDDELADYATRRGDPLRGVHLFNSASEREWWAPLYPDRRVLRRDASVAVFEKQSGFGGRSVHEWTAEVFAEDGGPVLSGQYSLWIRVEREKARERKKETIKFEPYTDEQIDEIDAAYAAQSGRRRGSDPRWFEDVEVGDVLPETVKGPLQITDIICWHIGTGMGTYRTSSADLAYANRQRIPRFYFRDDLNVPDVLQRVHWDPEFARKSGNPSTFDVGKMREAWFTHVLTAWMGDDAWLWRLQIEFRRFNYVGDTQWISGHVSGKHIDESGRCIVEVDLTARNQRGEDTTFGKGSVILPSREHGQVELPVPPGGARNLVDAMDGIQAEFDARNAAAAEEQVTHA
ncbi:MAG TPA: hypothetical protein VGH31_02395 [Acidimicrobiales bacterium]